MSDANSRFEMYARQVIEAYCPRFEVFLSERYGPDKATYATPDVMVADNGQIVAVLECKATKLTYDAQFADDPVESAERAYAQIIRGVTQLWRFIAHVRCGRYAKQPIADNVNLVVLTMDSWLRSAGSLMDQVFLRARDLAKQHPEISEDDMRPVLFCSIQELVEILAMSSEDDFLYTLTIAARPEYDLWRLPQIRRETGLPQLKKAFPFNLDDLLPWWGRLRRPERPGI